MASLTICGMKIQEERRGKGLSLNNTNHLGARKKTETQCWCNLLYACLKKTHNSPAHTLNLNEGSNTASSSTKFFLGSRDRFSQHRNDTSKDYTRGRQLIEQERNLDDDKSFLNI